MSFGVVFEVVGPILVRFSVVKAGEVKLVKLLNHELSGAGGSDIVDVVSRLLSSVGYDPWRKKNTASMQVKHLMLRSVKPTCETAGLEELLHAVEHSHHHHFPVVGVDGGFRGIFSFDECGFGVLPVVDPANPKTLVGILEQRTVLKIYHQKRQKCQKRQDGEAEPCPQG